MVSDNIKCLYCKKTITVKISYNFYNRVNITFEEVFGGKMYVRREKMKTRTSLRVI